MSAAMPSSISPRSLVCVDVDPVLGAFALGSLERDEWRDVAAHLAVCPKCRVGLARYETSLSVIAQSIPEVAPPPALRLRLLEEITQSKQQIDQPAKPSPIVRSLPRVRRLTIALAAIAAVLVIALGTTAFLLVQARSQRNEAVSDRREIAEYLRHGGNMVAMVPVEGLSAGAEGSLIVAPDQPRALVIVSGLTPAPDGGSYRVWVERAGQRVWLASLELSSDGTGYLLTSAPQPISTYERMGIVRQQPSQPDVDVFTVAIQTAVSPPTP